MKDTGFSIILCLRIEARKKKERYLLICQISFPTFSTQFYAALRLTDRQRSCFPILPLLLQNTTDCNNRSISGGADSDALGLVHCVYDRSVTHIQPYVSVI